ncbi:MAG: hypothetical protein GF344_00235 [Chitinivibrionales bacterium]|nr:hypothetical protein [Chitinivibrionales bacterium]MBD3355559.1 hypothetical protein [Chitinivibrionales bacterium]
MFYHLQKGVGTKSSSRFDVRFIAMVLVSFMAIGCGPSLKRMDYLEDQHVPRAGECKVVFKRDVEIRSEKGKIIGTLKVGDTGFSSRCHEDDILEILRKEACDIGADVVVLRKIRQPDFLSSCYRVTADFVRLSDSTYVERIESDEAYDSTAVKRRVRDRKAMQVAFAVVGGVIGLTLSFVLASMKY